MAAVLTSVATYRRRIGAPLERVWENVHDWEHLPWLHRESFRAIALEEAGDFGWRAAIGLHGAGDPEIRLELVIDDEGRGDRYVSRTTEGPGATSEIWTHLRPFDGDHTDIEVEFLLPDVHPGKKDALGRAYVGLYTLLWDQDEAMMQRRAWLLAKERAKPAAETIDLGPESGLEGRLPLRIEVGGRPAVLARVDGELVAFDALCPHWLGPLDGAPIEDGRVVCPWHGYAFDVRTGRGCDVAEKLRLATGVRVERVGDRVRVVREGLGSSA